MTQPVELITSDCSIQANMLARYNDVTRTIQGHAHMELMFGKWDTLPYTIQLELLDGHRIDLTIRSGQPDDWFITGLPRPKPQEWTRRQLNTNVLHFVYIQRHRTISTRNNKRYTILAGGWRLWYADNQDAPQTLFSNVPNSQFLDLLLKMSRTMGKQILQPLRQGVIIAAEDEAKHMRQLPSCGDGLFRLDIPWRINA